MREIPCYETRRLLFHNRVERGAGSQWEAPQRVTCFFYLCNVMVSEANPVQSACYTREKCWSRQHKLRKTSIGCFLFFPCTALMEFGGVTLLGLKRSEAIHHAQQGKTLFSQQKLRYD